MSVIGSNVKIKHEKLRLIRESPKQMFFESESGTSRVMKKEYLNTIRETKVSDTFNAYVRLAYIEEDKVDEILEDFFENAKQHYEKIQDTVNGAIDSIYEFENQD